MFINPNSSDKQYHMLVSSSKAKILRHRGGQVKLTFTTQQFSLQHTVLCCAPKLALQLLQCMLCLNLTAHQQIRAKKKGSNVSRFSLLLIRWTGYHRVRCSEFVHTAPLLRPSSLLLQVDCSECACPASN